MNNVFAVSVAFCCFSMVLSLRMVVRPRSTTTESPIHLPCRSDRDCKRIVCDNYGEVPECHRAASSPTGAECHCHVPDECLVNADCVPECGPSATCDDRACHGQCIHN
ncbi:hypothetical protein DPMN_160705 [Dreissena polymorpha]|uniref:Uncharacterized protein n=2 Tax=Dreissena polymorpha TaxID=45954 RepID=A0A9D4EMQ0_DREPO|nr:hypothetical protein DPMN_160705 [Dreissena polymorpha]